METYKKDRRCETCGEIGTRDSCSDESEKRKVQRECKNCGFTWTELPYDFEDAKRAVLAYLDTAKWTVGYDRKLKARLQEKADAKQREQVEAERIRKLNRTCLDRFLEWLTDREKTTTSEYPPF